MCKKVNLKLSRFLRAEMEQKGDQLHQESISCSICLDLLKDPVTIPCGHSYCIDCITSFWDGDEKKTHSCPQCRQTFTPRPVLVISTMLAALVEQLKKTGLQAAPADHCYAGPEDVACDSCTGRKLKAVKSCLVCLVSYCETHVQPHYHSPAFGTHKLVEPSKKLQENICSRHDEVMKMFYRVWMDVSELRDKLQDLLRRTWTNISPTVTDVDVLLTEQEPKTRTGFLRYSCEITLDPNTANTRLLLCEGNRKVSRVSQHQFYPHHPDRFTVWSQVLSRESLTGRRYWEVERRGIVCVAVTFKSINRAGEGKECGFGFNDKSLMLFCDNDSYNFWYSNMFTRVSGPQSSRIGVYLDHSAGILSFYSVSETKTLLHRVQTTFTQPLYTGLRVYPDSSGEMCNVKNTEIL